MLRRRNTSGKGVLHFSERTKYRGIWIRRLCSNRTLSFVLIPILFLLIQNANFFIKKPLDIDFISNPSNNDSDISTNVNVIENRNDENQDIQKDIKTITASYTTNKFPNKNKVAFVTFSHMADIAKFNKIILGAVKTWFPKDEVYYIVLNQQWRETFVHWKRDLIRENQTQVELIQPIFVDCPESAHVESPCCKQEKGLIEFYDKYYHERDYSWVYFADDDMFVNTRILHEYLDILPYGLTTEHAKYLNGPLVLLSNSNSPQKLGHGEVAKIPYSCEKKDNSYKYPWGQPVVYNRKAMESIIAGLRLGGLVKQCLEFDVNHDVGNAIFHWMYSIPYASFPRIFNLKGVGAQTKFRTNLQRMEQNKQKLFREDVTGIHGIDFHHYFSQQLFWTRRVPDSIKVFDQKGKLPPDVYFGFGHVTGFLSTDTFAKYGSPNEWKDEWHTMPISECLKKINMKIYE